MKKPKTLPPLREHPSYSEKLEAALHAIMRKFVFIPLLEALNLGKDKLENAKKSALVLALGQGRVQYVDDHFEGQFSGAISGELKKMGAKWNGRQSWWSIPLKKLPDEIRSAIAVSRSRFQAMADRANKVLSAIDPGKVAAEVDVASLFDSAIFTMDKNFQANVNKLGIRVKMTPDTKAFIARQYSENSKLDIKGWAEKEIAALRQKVQLHTLEHGLRRESLVSEIQKRDGVSARKARFLARQETSLLMSAFQEKRYQDAGLQKYEWRCVNNPPVPGLKASQQPPHVVRPDHWELNHSIQTWNSPPVVDRDTGRRAHPKQDYNCRCQAIPVIG